VRDHVAKHEAYHGRAVTVLGEFGFYVTCVTFGFIFAASEGGHITGLNMAGCGNPFEKHAYTFFNPFTFGPNPLGVDTGSCRGASSLNSECAIIPGLHVSHPNARGQGRTLGRHGRDRASIG